MLWGDGMQSHHDEEPLLGECTRGGLRTRLAGVVWSKLVLLRCRTTSDKFCCFGKVFEEPGTVLNTITYYLLNHLVMKRGVRAGVFPISLPSMKSSRNINQYWIAFNIIGRSSTDNYQRNWQYHFPLWLSNAIKQNLSNLMKLFVCTRTGIDTTIPLPDGDIEISLSNTYIATSIQPAY